MTKVFIVDDHYIVREGIRMVLELEEEFEVVGEAENGLQALQLLEQQLFLQLCKQIVLQKS